PLRCAAAGDVRRVQTTDAAIGVDIWSGAAIASRLKSAGCALCTANGTQRRGTHLALTAGMARGIQVHGTDWCTLTFGVREYLTNARVAYDYQDIDRDRQADELVVAMMDGRRRFPVVVVHERVLTNPTRAELQRTLDDYQIQPEGDGRRRR